LWHAATNEQKVMKVWPVPANDVLYMECTGYVRSATIFDATGRTVGWWTPQRSGFIEFDIQNLPAGVYMLRIELPDSTERRSFTKNY